MKTSIKARISIAAAFVVFGAVLFTPKSVPHWLWEIEGIVLTVTLMAAAAVGAVMWERYGPNGCRLHEWEAARAAREATGIQLVRRDEVGYDEPATLHYPEGDAR
jgi:hypothetical protein